MTAEDGAFYSAEDADSEGEEGRFYVWTMDELQELLGPDQAEKWALIFNFSPAGNFTDEASGRPTGANILHLTKTLDRWAQTLDLPTDDLRAEWKAVRQVLLEHRSKRVRPLLDDKILCDWNGLMIAALATGGRVLQQPALVTAAEKAVTFVLKRMRDPHGRLYHRYREEDLAVSGQASDYAYLIFGLLNLYQSTFNLTHAEEASLFRRK